MSETLNPDVQPNEQNIVNTPEQADNAATTEFSNEQPAPETVEEIPAVQDEESDNVGARPASRQEIIERLKAEYPDAECSLDYDEALRLHV